MSETKNTWKDKLYETDNPLIEVEELDLDYQTAKGCVNALSHINFSIHRGEFYYCIRSKWLWKIYLY